MEWEVNLSAFQHTEIGPEEEVPGDPSDSGITNLCNLPPAYLIEQSS